MHDSLLKFLALLNDRAVVRLTVCLLPGILLSKVAGKLDLGETVRIASVMLVLAGGALFVFWRQVAERLLGEPEDAEVEEGSSLPPAEISRASFSPASMAELTRLCNGDKSAAMQALMIESELHPHLPTAEAISLAAHRKRVEQTLASAAKGHGH